MHHTNSMSDSTLPLLETTKRILMEPTCMPQRRQLLAGAAIGGAVATAGCFIPDPDEVDDDDPVDDDPVDDPTDDDPTDDPADDDEEDDGEDEPESPPGELDGLSERYAAILDELAWAETSYEAGRSAYSNEHAAYRSLVESLQDEDEVTAVDVNQLRSRNDDLQAVFDGPLAPFAHLQSAVQTAGFISELDDQVTIDDQQRVQDTLDRLRGKLASVAPENLERTDDLSADPLTSRIVTATDAPALLKSRSRVAAVRSEPTTAQPRPLFELRYEGAVSGSRFAYSTDAATAVGAPSIAGRPGESVFAEPTMVPEEPDLSAAVDVETVFEPVANPVDRVQEVWLVVNEFLAATADRVTEARRYDVGLLPGTPVYLQEYDTPANAADAVDVLFEGPVSEPEPVVNPDIGGETWRGIVYDGETGPLYAALAQAGPVVAVVGPSRDPLEERDPDADTPGWIRRLEWSFLADISSGAD